MTQQYTRPARQDSNPTAISPSGQSDDELLARLRSSKSTSNPTTPAKNTIGNTPPPTVDNLPTPVRNDTTVVPAEKPFRADSTNQMLVERVQAQRTELARLKDQVTNMTAQLATHDTELAGYKAIADNALLDTHFADKHTIAVQQIADLTDRINQLERSNSILYAITIRFKQELDRCLLEGHLLVHRANKAWVLLSGSEQDELIDAHGYLTADATNPNLSIGDRAMREFKRITTWSHFEIFAVLRAARLPYDTEQFALAGFANVLEMVTGNLPELPIISEERRKQRCAALREQYRDENGQVEMSLGYSWTGGDDKDERHELHDNESDV